MMPFISRYPERYENLKSFLRDKSPLPNVYIRRISAAAATLHQRYIEDFVFIHIPKTGGTSLERALGLPFLNHDDAMQRQAKLGDARWQNRFKFTVIRNPYHRSVSLYLYNNRHRRWSEMEFVADFERRLGRLCEQKDTNSLPRRFLQWDWITDEQNKILIDRVYQLEELHECERELSEILKRRIRVPIIKRGNRSHLAEALLTQEARGMISHLCATDFERFSFAR